MNTPNNAQPMNPDAPQVVNVNPADVAKLTLQFLARASLMPAERSQFALCEQMMQAIASGNVMLAPVARPGMDAPPPNGKDTAAETGARPN